MQTERAQARELHVNGVVQGVGMRPFCARLAQQLHVCGWVENTTAGVTLHIEARDAQTLDAFAQRLVDDAPPAARILSLETREVPAEGFGGFCIRASDAWGSRSTLVSPDIATCDECLAELFDEHDARYHYPFVNCTNCGPRFTIIEDLPYDRPVTSMKRFAMCESCQGEYDDCTDRRYHAQPNACFACGPRLWWLDARDAESARGRLDAHGALVCEHEHVSREVSDAFVERAAQALRAGDVLAIKGLGGWHLACDAANERAVKRLRARKRRPTKPLAVMVRNVEAARELVTVNEEERRLLESCTRPIVLLRRRDAGAGAAALASGVADGLSELGVMLPATPLQHLLLAAFDAPLVMTSGNRSGEPIVATDAEALDALAHVADAFLGNNRAIVARYDDSVTRVLLDGCEQLVRRARGLAPAPLMLDEAHAAAPDGPTIFATGPEQKATVCWSSGSRMYVSQHLGDLERLGAWRAWDEARVRYEALFDLHADVMACDLHPEYLAGKWARAEHARTGVPLVEVQHHHAHIASVLGEHGLDGPVLGLALDGTGYGSDGTIWGGELAIVTRTEFTRIWHVPTFALPGGAAAIWQPERIAYALIRAADAQATGQSGAPAALLAPFAKGNPQRDALLARYEHGELLDAMLARGVNCPPCTSAGRLFDGVAALLGVCTQPSYDGEAACLLEAQAHRELAAQGKCIDTWSGECAHEPICARYETPFTALSFHGLFVATIIDACERARAASGLATVAVSGGCFANRLVMQGVTQGLRARGFNVLANRELPCNDGCIAYGQAVVARAIMLGE